MRQFVVCGHEVPTTPEFSLDDLPGSGGRMDLLARCVSAGLFTSHDIRDARVHLVCQNEVTVRFDGSTVRHLRPDERSTAARVRTALDNVEKAIGHQPATVSQGVEVYRFGLDETLSALDGEIVWLHGDGDPLGATDPPENPVFVLSDHQPFTESDRATLDRHADHRLSVSPETIHADHAISVAHNWLDTDGFERY